MCVCLCVWNMQSALQKVIRAKHQSFYICQAHVSYKKAISAKLKIPSD